MNSSGEPSKKYLPVHPELKVHSIQEFYSVPKHYLEYLEQDMQTYGQLVQYLHTIRCADNESDNIQMRMESRIDAVWNRYLNYIREGASHNRILQLRQINRKTWYAANLLSLFLISPGTLAPKVLSRRMEFILNEMDDLADSIKSENSQLFETWQSYFIIRIHKLS